METNDSKSRSSDDIDLSQFSRWVGRGFNKIGSSFIYSIATLRNMFVANLIFFSVIIAAGVGFGFLYYELLAKKYYKSTMVLSCEYLNAQIVENTIHKLNNLCGDANQQELANELKIDTAIAKKIQSFSYKPFVSEEYIVEIEVLKEQLNNVAADKKDLVAKIIKKLEIDNKGSYEISVLVYQPEIVKELEAPLVDYFRTNDYVKRRIEITRKNIEVRKAKLIKESRSLDSLRSVLLLNYQGRAKSERGSNNVILNEERMTNPIEVLQENIKLVSEIAALERLLYIHPDFELIDGFATFKQPENITLREIMIIAFLSSVIGGFLIIGLIRFDRVLANYNINR